MSTVTIGIATFVAIFGGAVLGMGLAGRPPSDHLTRDTRDAISVSMAIVGALSALVLSLLITQSSNAFASRADAVSGLSANVPRMDHVLKVYGPQADAARGILQQYAERKARELSGSALAASPAPALDVLETLNERIFSLAPADDVQRARKDQAEHILGVIADERWLPVEKRTTPIPTPLPALLVFAAVHEFRTVRPEQPDGAGLPRPLRLGGFGRGVHVIERGSPTGGLIRTPVGPVLRAVHQMI